MRLIISERCESYQPQRPGRLSIFASIRPIRSSLALSDRINCASTFAANISTVFCSTAMDSYKTVNASFREWADVRHDREVTFNSSGNTGRAEKTG